MECRQLPTIFPLFSTKWLSMHQSLVSWLMPSLSGGLNGRNTSLHSYSALIWVSFYSLEASLGFHWWFQSFSIKQDSLPRLGPSFTWFQSFWVYTFKSLRWNTISQKLQTSYTMIWRVKWILEGSWEIPQIPKTKKRRKRKRLNRRCLGITSGSWKITRMARKRGKSRNKNRWCY